jgi:hypothetical protein
MINGDGRTSYTAQAYVRANSGINSFAQLKGKRACHTGFLKSAGMYVSHWPRHPCLIFGIAVLSQACSSSERCSAQVHADWLWGSQRLH